MAGKPQFQAMRLSTRDRFDWGPGHRLEVRVNASVQLDVHPAPFFLMVVDCFLMLLA